MGGGIEYAPQALRDLFEKCRVAAPGLGLKLGGILGDKPHTYGYHRARAVLSASDYSVQAADDKAGDAWAASALDLTPTGAAAQKLMTQRLIDATARKDPRLKAVREFFGSVDGRNVTGRDVRGGYAVTSDDSHLWHVHLSIFRRYANDAAALAPIADVIAGRPAAPQPPATPQPTEEDEDEMALYIVAVDRTDCDKRKRPWPGYMLTNGIDQIRHIEAPSGKGNNVAAWQSVGVKAATSTITVAEYDALVKAAAQ